MSDEIKKGDWVRYVGGYGHRWLTGHEVTSVKDGIAIVTDPAGQPWMFHPEWLEKVARHNTDSGTNPKDLLGIKKVQLNLVPPSSVIYQALAMEDGARKYGPFNWRQNKVIASIYIAAALRHIYAWQDGENDAQDSKKPHLGHALACLGIIVDALETGNIVDDRPLTGQASVLIARYEKK